MFAQPPALLFFIAKELADRKPFERLFEFALMRRNYTRESWRQFRSERDFAFAFVDKIKKLADDFIAAFFR